VALGVASQQLDPLDPVPAAVSHQIPRQYLAFTACLLTDDQGVAGPAAAPVWAGMQDASLATRAKVQFLPAVAASTPDAVAPYLASLLQRRCDLVLAVGSAEVGAASAGAKSHPSVRFVLVGDQSGSPNVTALAWSSASQVRESARRTVVSAVRGTGG